MKNVLKIGVLVSGSGSNLQSIIDSIERGLLDAVIAIVMQAVVEVRDDDTRDTLAHRILAMEHRIYPQVIQLYAEGRIEFRGRKALIKDASLSPDVAIVNPLLEEF